MSARDKILSAIAANKPSRLPLPALPTAPIDKESFVKTRKFVAMLESIGGKVVEVQDLQPVRHLLDGLIQSGRSVACTSEDLGTGNYKVTPAHTAPELERIDTAFMRGSFGIAENGAVWLYESQFTNRLLPFICQHLVIVLEEEAILSDMHEAYQKINIDREGFSLFLAGPSKTADIEQSLVIGAHGARSATVYLLKGAARTK